MAVKCQSNSSKEIGKAPRERKRSHGRADRQDGTKPFHLDTGAWEAKQLWRQIPERALLAWAALPGPPQSRETHANLQGNPALPPHALSQEVMSRWIVEGDRPRKSLKWANNPTRECHSIQKTWDRTRETGKGTFWACVPGSCRNGCTAGLESQWTRPGQEYREGRPPGAGGRMGEREGRVI